MAYTDSKENKDLLVKCDQMFRYALDHPSWVEGRKAMIKCFQYVEGSQWTTEELSILAERGQPPTVNNQMAVTVNKLRGDLADQKFKIGTRGRNEPMDKLVADALSDIFLYIRQSNDLEFEEEDMATDGFTAGLGALEVYVEFDDLYQPEIKIRSRDCLGVYPDPDSRRYDWNEDANFIAVAQWYDADDVAEKYPKAAKYVQGVLLNSAEPSSSQSDSVDQLENNSYVDQKKGRIRVVTLEYKKRENECIYFSESGEIVHDDDPKKKETLAQWDAQKIEYEQIDRLGTKICRAVFTYGVMLSHKVTRNKLFSFIPYWVYRRKNGSPYSPVYLALTMQDAVNKRESKALHLLNSNRLLYERAAITDKDNVATEMHKPDGMVEFEDGALSQEKVVFQNNIELAQSQFTMHLRAQDDVYKITGVDPRVGNNTQEVRSGVGLKQKFNEAGKPSASIFTNLRRTRKITGRVLLDRVQNYYTREKTFLVTDDQNAARVVTVDADTMTKAKTGQYDVIVDDFVDSASVQQEQFGLLMQYLPNILPFGPFWVKKLIQLSDLRKKDELIADIEAQGKPPPTEPKISITATIDQLSPPERAFFYEKMGNPQLAQEIVQSGLQTTQQLKSSTDIQKEMIKKQVPEQKDQSAVEAEREKQNTERIKGQMSQQTEMVKARTAQQKGEMDLRKGEIAIQKELIKAATPKPIKQTGGEGQ